jgi:hypothetical protein
MSQLLILGVARGRDSKKTDLYMYPGAVSLETGGGKLEQ